MISCLCPTFNRYPKLGWLLEEAVECFLRQDYANKELLILNDTRGQKLAFDHPQVRIFNSQIRLPDLSAKIQYLIDRADGDLFCRWDDDDLSLPWRLSYSLERLGDRIEWRPENFWFANGDRPWKEDRHPGNTHVMAISHLWIPIPSPRCEREPERKQQPITQAARDSEMTETFGRVRLPFGCWRRFRSA